MADCVPSRWKKVFVVDQTFWKVGKGRRDEVKKTEKTVFEDDTEWAERETEWLSSDRTAREGRVYSVQRDQAVVTAIAVVAAGKDGNDFLLRNC